MEKITSKDLASILIKLAPKKDSGLSRKDWIKIITQEDAKRAYQIGQYKGAK